MSPGGLIANASGEKNKKKASPKTVFETIAQSSECFHQSSLFFELLPLTDIVCRLSFYIHNPCTTFDRSGKCTGIFKGGTGGLTLCGENGSRRELFVFLRSVSARSASNRT